MPLESATYINQLVPSNPVQTDPTSQGFDHIDMIKSVLQSTFPNATGPISGTPAQLNAAAAAFNSPAVQVVANGTTQGGEIDLLGIGPASGATTQSPAGTVRLVNSGTGSVGATGPGAGALSVIINDATNANPVTAMSVSQQGEANFPVSVNAPSILQAGNPLIPSGAIIMWSGSATAIPPGWLLCNGLNGTPNLIGQFIVGAGPAGSSYVQSQTGGASSSTVTSTTAGLHNHTGATGSGGGSTLTATADQQGAHNHTGADGAYTLTINDIPSHSHVETTAQSAGGPYDGYNIVASANLAPINISTQPTGGGGAHSHTISTDGLHSHNITVSPLPAFTLLISLDGSHDHSVTVPTVPPFYALCFIMKT